MNRHKSYEECMISLHRLGLLNFLSRSFHDQFHFKSLKQYVGRTYYPLLMTSSGWYGLLLHTGTKTYEPILQTTYTRRLKNQSGAAMLKTPLFLILKAWELTINRPIKTELHIARWEKIKKFSEIVWRRNRRDNCRVTWAITFEDRLPY